MDISFYRALRPPDAQIGKWLERYMDRKKKERKVCGWIDRWDH